MKYKFIEKPIQIKDITKECPIDPCLLENNEKQIGQFCDFLQGDKKLLLVNGYRGSGKTKIVNFISDSLDTEALVLQYKCIETTILDDMLLGFFEYFRYYTGFGKITPPKNKVENFTQKINSYFNTITNPILIVIDSFQSLMKEHSTEIIDFIKHLTTFPNVKVIIVSKTAPVKEFSDIDFDQVTILAFSQKIFEKFIRNNGIKQIGVISNEFYKLTKGYYNNIVLSLNIMNLRQLNLVSFLEMYSKSYMPFPEFVIREAMDLVDPVSIHLFRLLTVMRIPIHINLLQSLHLFDEGRASFYVQNSFLTTNGDHLYLKDYFRDIIEHQIPENVMIKLHSACIDLYNTQLPLKPLERDLRLSRQTMRNEIEYHSLFIPKKPVLKQPPKNIPVEPVLAKQGELKMVNPEIENNPPTPEEIAEETHEEKLNKISFIVEDETLDNIADSIKDYIDTTVENKKFEEESLEMNLSQLLNAAKDEEQKYNYKNVVKLYQQALTKTEDENFYTFLPTIYIKLAKAYQNLSDWYEALECYTQAEDFYVNTSNSEKVSEIKLEIANIYYLMYKLENAKFILNELEKTPNLPNELKIKINLTGAKITTNPDEEYEYYKKSIPLVEINTDKTMVAELYYKYAVANDEKDNPRGAVQFYKKCINVDKNPNINPYLSMALANLAELYDEAGSPQQAIKYYKESIEIDLNNKNYNGLYYSATHLGEIYLSINETQAFQYMNKALEYAKLLKEPYYEAQAFLDIGDFYYKQRKNELAYKYFMEAYKVAKISFTKENLNKITSRIEDLKPRFSEDQFKQLQEKYDK